MDIQGYWAACLRQDRAEMQKYFHPGAYINWHNTDEHFTVEEFLRANCEYPGSWGGNIQRVEQLEDLVITVVRVYARDATLSFHVTSFFRLEGERIAALDEYWGDDGPPPQWRQAKHIGRPIGRAN